LAEGISRSFRELPFGGVFTGLSKTAPMLLIGVPLTLARIPFSWILASYLGFGVTGIWWAISISTCTKGVGLAALFWFVQKRFPVSPLLTEGATTR
jgi:Na+-driven multidrug efflux pump